MHSGGRPSTGCALKALAVAQPVTYDIGTQMWRDAHVLLRVIQCASQLDGQRSYKHSCHKQERALSRRQAGEAGSIGTCLRALMKVLISVLQNLQEKQPLPGPSVTCSSLTTSFSGPHFCSLLSPSRHIRGGEGDRRNYATEGGFRGLC